MLWGKVRVEACRSYRSHRAPEEESRPCHAAGLEEDVPWVGEQPMSVTDIGTGLCPHGKLGDLSSPPDAGKLPR